MSNLDQENTFVVLDTETTGLSFQEDRVIEIGAIKLQNLKPKQKFHTYLRVDRSSSPQALAVHGITDGFLADKPTFAALYHTFLDFVAGSTLVIHNAPFDMGFLQAELDRVGYPNRLDSICPVIDTYRLAKQCYPGKKNSLDALCSRFGVDTQHRSLHGALKDADLLVKVYLQLRSQQGKLGLQTSTTSIGEQDNDVQDWSGLTCAIELTTAEQKLEQEWWPDVDPV